MRVKIREPQTFPVSYGSISRGSIFNAGIEKCRTLIKTDQVVNKHEVSVDLETGGSLGYQSYQLFYLLKVISPLEVERT